MKRAFIKHAHITIYAGVPPFVEAIQGTEPLPTLDYADKPAIGHAWPGQGGVFAGDVRGDDGTVFGLIVPQLGPAMDVGRAAWGQPGALDLSTWDGKANTARLIDTCPAAKLAADFKCDGLSDFYLPSKRELLLALANVPHLFGTSSYYWSSTPSGEQCAWAVDFEDGSTYYRNRVTEFRVCPVRRFIY